MIQQPNTWQALGDIVARLVEKETRQRWNAPGDDATPKKETGDE